MKTSLKEKSFATETSEGKSSFPGNRGTDSLSKKKGRSAILKKIAAFLVILICFFFLGKTLLGNLGEVSAQKWDLKPSFLLLSFLFLMVNLAVSAFAWKKILLLFGIRLPFDQSFKIIFVSGLGKYLPGKIWLYLSQIYLSRRANIPKSVCIFSMLLLFAAYNLAGVLVFLFSLFLWNMFSPVLISLALFVTFALFLLVFSPRVLNRILSILTIISKRFKDGMIPEALSARSRTSQVGQIILILMADWVIFGVAVYFLINSFYHIDVSHTLILCGIFAISVITGIASFIVPAGLGVREGVQSYLLGLFLPIPTAILISLIMRVWMTSGELACSLVALKIKKPELW